MSRDEKKRQLQQELAAIEAEEKKERAALIEQQQITAVRHHDVLLKLVRASCRHKETGKGVSEGCVRCFLLEAQKHEYWPDPKYRLELNLVRIADDS